MTFENKKKNIHEEMDRGDESYRAAEVLSKEGLFSDSISRIYYAAFHYASALLLSKGLETQSHKGMGHLLSLHFVKEGLIEPKYSRIFSQSQKFREESDYTAGFVFTREDVTEELRKVKEFREVIVDYLIKNRLFG